MGRRGSTMRELAEIALVSIGDVRGNHFAFRGTQCVRCAEQNFCQFEQGFGRLRAENEWTNNSGHSFGKLDVRHSVSSCLFEKDSRGVSSIADLRTILRKYYGLDSARE